MIATAFDFNTSKVLNKKEIIFVAKTLLNYLPKNLNEKKTLLLCWFNTLFKRLVKKQQKNQNHFKMTANIMQSFYKIISF